MDKRWIIIAAFVLFDGFSSHYKSIFFGAPIREGNPINAFIFGTFGIGALAIMVPAVVFIMWLVVRFLAPVIDKHEKRNNTRDLIINTFLVAYSPIIFFGAYSMLAQFTGIPYHNPFTYPLLFVLVMTLVILYNIYEELKWRRKTKRN